jgi:hypothetical protein
MADTKASAFPLLTTPAQYGTYVSVIGSPTTTPTNNNLKVGEFFTEQFLALSTAYTGTSVTTLQKLFNVPTNGAVNVTASTSYFFTGEFDLSAMSASSGTFGFGFLGTATITSIKWTTLATKTAISGVNSAFMTTGTTTASTQISAATTTATGHAIFSGIVRINAAGTFIPAFSVSIAAAAIVGVNSWFRIVPIGANTATSSGNVS